MTVYADFLVFLWQTVESSSGYFASADLFLFLETIFSQFLWVVHSLPVNEFIFFFIFCCCFYYLFIASNKPTNRKKPVGTGQQVVFYCILQPFIEPFSFKSPLKSKDQLHRKSTNCATTFVDVTSVQIHPGCFLFSSQLHCCLSHSLL